MTTATTPMTNAPYVLREQSDEGVVTLTMNRPDQFNAMSDEMIAAIQTELDQIETDKSVRCVVIAANGKAFCAGHDMKQFAANYEEDYFHDLLARCSGMMQTITSLPVPVIARVQGIATAGGCQLVATCDLAVASDTAKFAVSGINFGLFCATPSVPLARNLSRKHAFEMLVTGKFIDPSKAKEWGLINDFCPEGELDERIKELTDSICAKSKTPITLGKDMFYKHLSMELDDAYEYASKRMVANLMTEDAREGLKAFAERRKPVWKDC